MAMQLIVARRFPRFVRLSVHIDTTKMDPLDAAKPDPAWVITQTWSLPPRNAGEAAAAYTARLTPWFAGVKADLREQAVARLADLTDDADPGVALPGEGQAF